MTYPLLWMTVVIGLTGAPRCGAAVLDGFRPQYPTTSPIITTHDDGPATFSLPLCTNLPTLNDSGVSENNISATSAPDPGSLILALIAGAALGKYRRPRRAGRGAA